MNDNIQRVTNIHLSVPDHKSSFISDKYNGRIVKMLHATIISRLLGVLVEALRVYYGDISYLVLYRVRNENKHNVPPGFV